MEYLQLTAQLFANARNRKTWNFTDSCKLFVSRTIYAMYHGLPKGRFSAKVSTRMHVKLSLLISAGISRAFYC